MPTAWLRFSFVFLPVMVFAAPASAAQSIEDEDLALVYGDKSTVSIATGSKQSIRRAPAVATVITAEDIATMGAVDLDEVMETVPGVHVNRNAGFYNSIYVIRGIGVGPANPQVLILQNGIPMTTVYTGDKGVGWGGLSLENVARIEIIRGPGSALYGADAFAGVINIITKTAQDAPGTQLGARGGSFDTWDTWVQHGGKLGSVDVATYFRVGHTDGSHEIIERDAASFSPASLAPGPVNKGRDALDAALDLGYAKWRWRSSLKYRDNMETGAGVSSALDPRTRFTSDRFTSDLSWIDPQFAPDWSLGVMLSYLYYSEINPNGLMLFPPGINFGTGPFPDGVIGGPNRWERQYRFSIFTSYSGFINHRVRVGVGYDDLDLYKTSTYKNYLLGPGGTPIPTGQVQEYSSIQPHILPQQRTIAYVYAQDEWQFAKDWALTTGLRYDRYSDFGATTNPRLALVWDAAYNLTAKLLYGEAFRAPSFTEQYGINPVANGNPGLSPETIKSQEAALSWQARPDTQVNLSFFTYRMKNIIRAVSNAPAPGSTYNNTGDQRGSGMELETIWDVSRSLRLSGNYEHQRAIDETTGLDAGYAPHEHIYARADWRFVSGWLCSTQLNWVSNRKRDRRDANNNGIPDDTRSDIADYTTVDLTVETRTKRDQWNFMFSIRNLFDTDVREPSLSPGSIPNDFPMPGRWYLMQLRYQL